MYAIRSYYGNTDFFAQPKRGSSASSDIHVASLNRETPDNSDGGAVAAATACYLADLRSEGQQRENLLFFTHRLLTDVARRHSKVQEQDIFDFWVERLELNDPGKFLSYNFV